MIRRIETYLDRKLWESDPAGPGRARMVRTLRVFYATFRDLAGGQLTLQAMGLVYTTLLSLVPLLAVSFSVLKAFGVHNQIEPALLTLLAPLGEKAGEISSRIIGFVENMKVGVLGVLGLALLFYTATSLMQKIESAINRIWQIRHPRSFLQRFSEYLSVLTVGPVLVFTALGITASLTSATVVQALASRWGLTQLVTDLTKLVPYVLIIGAFTFVYLFIPNKKVKVASALAGGLFAGILWETSGFVFAAFISSSTRYAAIYSSFAILIFFLIWLYLSWLILLLGAKFAFYHQHPAYLSRHRQVLPLGIADTEKLAFYIMALIARHFYEKEEAWDADALSHRLAAPIDAVESILRTLERHGILMTTDAQPPRYVPACALEMVTLKEFLDAIRNPGSPKKGPPVHPSPSVMADAIVQKLDAAMEEALAHHTLKDLARLGMEGIKEPREWERSAVKH